MNVVVLTSIFKPEPVVGAQTALSIAKELASRGHKVTVVTSFPSRPAGKLYPGYRRRLYQKEREPSGFEIVRCFSVPSPKSTLPSRFIENISFGLTAAIYLLFIPKVDVVYSNTWFIFATGLMSLTVRLRRIPYVIQVTDLYPESLVSQARLKFGSLVYRFLRRIDQWISAGASAVFVLTQYFAKTYIEDRKISASKIAVIPAWVEGDLDGADPEKSTAIRRQFGIGKSSFLAAFGGNIGVAAGVDTLLKTAALVPDIYIIIAGEGSELCRCKALASQTAPNHISFYSPWPKEYTMALYQAADVLVLPTHGAQSVASIPSKLIRYMLSGRAVIAASLPGTELECVVKASGCGWVIPPDDPWALAEALFAAKRLSIEELDRYGNHGREYAIKNFTEEVNLSKVVSILEGIPDRKGKDDKRTRSLDAG
jgi:glycosyltransferase involved in cell wall biosynthesis